MNEQKRAVVEIPRPRNAADQDSLTRRFNEHEDRVNAMLMQLQDNAYDTGYARGYLAGLAAAKPAGGDQ